MKEDEMKTRRTITDMKKGRTKTMNTAARKPKMRPETMMKKLFGTIGPTGAIPFDETARKSFKWKESDAENFEKSFQNSMTYSKNTAELILLRTYHELRAVARDFYNDFDMPAIAKATDSLADLIEEGIRAWYPLMKASMKADGGRITG
jgi:hypothetical protein